MGSRSVELTHGLGRGGGKGKPAPPKSGNPGEEPARRLRYTPGTTPLRGSRPRVRTCQHHRPEPVHRVRAQHPREHTTPMISTGDLKKGIAIELDGELWQILDYQHIKMGRGSAQVKIKLRNIRRGQTIERSFQAGEKW